MICLFLAHGLTTRGSALFGTSFEWCLETQVDFRRGPSRNSRPGKEAKISTFFVRHRLFDIKGFPILHFRALELWLKGILK
jgi:hypothetical protein